MPTLKSWTAAAVALGIAASLAGCAKKTAETARQQARTVSVVAVAPRLIEGGLMASGSLIPREDTAIFPQLTGFRVAKVLADAGAWVKAGQPLVQLDDTLLRAQLAQQTALATQQNVLADQAEAEAARVRASTTRACCRRSRSTPAASPPARPGLRPRRRTRPRGTCAPARR